MDVIVPVHRDTVMDRDHRIGAFPDAPKWGATVTEPRVAAAAMNPPNELVILRHRRSADPPRERVGAV